MKIDEAYFRKLTTLLIIFALLVLSFFILRPILLSIIGGLLLAFILYPIYSKLNSWIKLPKISALIICISIISIIILPLVFFSPAIVKESFGLFKAAQSIDLVEPFKNIFPSIFIDEELSYSISSLIREFMVKITHGLMNYFSDFVYSLPSIILHLFVVFFILFYSLVDKEKIITSIQDFLPFSKEVEKKLFQSTKDITLSVIYGWLIIGTIQGIILSIGIFILQVPNAFLLSLLAILAGIFPIVGPSLVGIPIAIYFVVNHSYISALIIILFTFLSSASDQLLRPLLVAKRTKLHPSLVLIGMIGGFLLMGILGFIIGPLILAYFFTIIEIYRNKPLPGVLLKKED